MSPTVSAIKGQSGHLLELLRLHGYGNEVRLRGYRRYGETTFALDHERRLAPRAGLEAAFATLRRAGLSGNRVVVWPR